MTYWTSGQTITQSGMNYLKIVSPTSSYTILNSDELIRMNCSAPCTLTLPTAIGIPGKSFLIRKEDTTSNHIAINTVSAQLINLTSTYDLRTIYGTLHIKSDNVGYHEVGTLENYGFIKMWSGSVVPNGWALCNGSNGTPDLRDRFIVGSGTTYSIGDTGGEASHTLTSDEMPSHTHPIGTSISSGSSNTVDEEGGARDAEAVTDATGGGSAHENRPPYYALAFLMRL